MSEPFEMNFEGYKKISAEFFQRLKAQPAPTQEQIDGGLKAIGIAYLHMKGTENEVLQARILFELAHKKANEFILAQLFKGLKG